MIRVNLLHDIAGGKGGSGIAATDAGGGDATGTGFRSRGEAGSNRDVLIKMMYFLLPAVLTYGYNYVETERLATQQLTLQTQLNTIQDKLKSYEPGLKDIEKFQEEKRKLDSQLEIIKLLSRERLRNVKSLSALQDIIPQKAWLEHMRITENKVELEGYASDDFVIAEFMKLLEESIYFANVLLDNSEESKRDLGTVKKFTIKCNLENM